MKILFLSNLFPDTREEYRGLDNALVLRHLADSCNVRTKVIALRPRVSITGGGSVLDLLALEQDRAFSPIYRSIPYVPKLGGPFNATLAARSLRGSLVEALTEFQPDHILCSWLFPDCVAVVNACAAIDYHTPITMIAQGSDVHTYLNSARRRRQIIQAIASPQVNQVITRSKRLGELLVSAGAAKEKISTIYNGVNGELFYPKDTQENSTRPPRLITVGNLLPVKNQSLLLQALTELNAQRNSENQTPAHLTIIGKGPLRSDLESLAHQLGQIDNVQFTGPLPPEDVAGHMRTADVFCLSSHNEGFPNVLLEAMACELPIVSTDVGGISELVSRYPLGQLVEANNERQLAATIATALNNQKQAPLPKFTKTWPEVAEEYSEILRSSTSKMPEKVSASTNKTV